MRKALIGLILAATAMTPVAAEAQNRGRDRAESVRHADERGQEQTERRAQRAERREQRQEARQQQAQPRQQARQQQVQPRQERRQERQARQVPQQQQQRVIRQQVQRQQPAAVAQRQRGDRRVETRQRDDRRGETRQRQSAYPDAWQGNPNDPRRRHYEQLERQNQYRYGTTEQRRDVRREVRQDRRGDRRADRRDWRRDWDRSWRTDRRYDWNRWRYTNRNIYRLPSYYSPYRNHRYSRFSIGFFLQPLFYNQRYWIGDPWQYRLPHAPYGTQWVRYYNDVLLVDVYTGEVIDVIYDFFW